MRSEFRSLNNPREDSRHMKRSFTAVASFTAVLWLIKIIEIMVGANFASYGVYPGQPGGLMGIIWSPLIHTSFSHLLANTAPLLLLGTALLYGYPRSAKIVIPAVYFGSGLGVWLFARDAFQVGASGLTFGLMFCVFTVGVLRSDKRATALSLVVFFLYGGMIWGIFPSKPDISFESHFFGAMIGIALAVLLSNYDPYPPEKQYSWEQDEGIDHEPENEPPGSVD